VKGVCGYGRYDDSPGTVGCPRAESDMSPCIARDGHLAVADTMRCVGCGQDPQQLLDELAQSGVNVESQRSGVAGFSRAHWAADRLCHVVREATQELVV
jgi:hypothetical protein